MKHPKTLKQQWGLIAVVMCGLMCLCLDTRGALPPGLQRLREARNLGTEEQARIKSTFFHAKYQMSDISLAIREQVDFLLTPALLVQEAVSEDIILTYPEE